MLRRLVLLGRLRGHGIDPGCGFTMKTTCRKSQLFLIGPRCWYFLIPGLVLKIVTLWLFNIAMESGPFINDFFLNLHLFTGFSMAMLVITRVEYVWSIASNSDMISKSRASSWFIMSPVLQPTVADRSRQVAAHEQSRARGDEEPQDLTATWNDEWCLVRGI